MARTKSKKRVTEAEREVCSSCGEEVCSSCGTKRRGKSWLCEPCANTTDEVEIELLVDGVPLTEQDSLDVELTGREKLTAQTAGVSLSWRIVRD